MWRPRFAKFREELGWQLDDLRARDVIVQARREHRRGEALGKVFGSFSVASVIGVPLGLEIAQHFGWYLLRTEHATPAALCGEVVALIERTTTLR